MIKHIVCFKLTNADEIKQKEAAKILLSMKGKVPQIIDIEVGCDFLRSPRSFDIILQVTLKNAAALEEYQNDSYHCGTVKKYMHAAAEESIAVDYEI